MRQRLPLNFSVLAALLVTGCGVNLQSSFETPGTSSSTSGTPSSTFVVRLLPASANVTAGQTLTFTSPFIGNVAWKVNGVDGGDAVHGTIDNAGRYTAPLIAVSDPVKVTAQLGAFANAPSASATLTLTNPTPAPARVNPASVLAGSSATLTISGGGFSPVSQVLLGSQPLATKYTDSSDLVVELTAELIQTGGAVTLSVANPAPGGGAASTTVTVMNPEPRLDMATPGTIVAGTTPTLTVAGSGFNSASQVTIGGQVVPTVYADSNHLLAQLSAQSAGSVDVAVANPLPGGGTSAHQQLTVLPSGQVTATNNPQVAAYTISAPDGSSVSVDFGPDTTYVLQTSAYPSPAGGGAVRVLVAGMKANSLYHMRAAIHFSDGSVAYDQDQTFRTGGFAQDTIPRVSVTKFLPSAEAGGVQMLDSIPSSKLALTAFDVDGNLIWAYNNPAHIGSWYYPAKMLPDGNLLLLVNGIGIREIDLAGNTIFELTQDAIQSAMDAAGYAFITLHHDIVKLPNGHYVVLGNIQKNVILNGNTDPTPMIGDILIDIDPNSKITWVWNSFDHLDVNRQPVDAFDWTHSNAIVPTSDGNLLLSVRHQSWILKIDYQNGKGTGDVLWKLGYQGDFALQSSSPADWFYLQHYPNILSENGGVMRLAIFDNGDNRIMDSMGDTCGTTGLPDCYSRAVVVDIDQNNMTASVEYQHTLSAYSFWGGSIQQMPSGNFVAGMSAMNWGSRVEEFTGDAAQAPVWQMDVFGQNSYRSLRLPSLYPGVTWP